MSDDVWNEPIITINGTTLTIAQAMTVRVALGSFILSLRSGLGTDEHGKRMTEAYMEALRDTVALF